MEEKPYAQRPAFLGIGEMVPDFSAITTWGKIKLSDYEGKWVVLFSHPADFTPVCTTEFIEFAKLHDEFANLNVQLIGLSIDSVYSHIAWIRNIEEKFGVKIPFPVIADLDMKVAHLFGMIHMGASSTATVRCAFIIDPKRALRAMIYYPLTNGRNIQEMLRIIKALQTTDKYGVSTPVNWQPGDEVIIPPPTNMEEMEKRVSEEQCKDWYFCKKELKDPVKL